jgi:hypothetical protein
LPRVPISCRLAIPSFRDAALGVTGFPEAPIVEG